MNIVVLLIQADKVALGAILKWTFSKLLTNDAGPVAGFAGVGARSATILNVLEFEVFFRVPYAVLEFY